MVARFNLISFDRDADFSNGVDKIVPQNIEAEESILGGILFDPEAMPRIAEMLSPEVFSLHTHQIIYRALFALYEEGTPTDVLTTTAKLADQDLLDRIGGQGKLLQMIQRTVSAVNIDQYAKLILEKYRRRQIIKLGNELVDEGYAGKDLLKLINKLEDVLDDAKDNLGPGFSLVEKVKKIREIESPVEQWYAWQKLCQKTRYSKKELIDLALASESVVDFDVVPAKDFAQKQLVREKFLIENLFRLGTVVLLTSEAKTGKSLFHYNLTYHISNGEDWGDFKINAPYKCLIVQTDEPEVELQERIIIRGITESDNVDLVTKFTPYQLPKLKKQILEKQYDFVVLDSLTSINRFSGFGENDQEFGFFVYELKEIAEQTGCCILLIHHTNKCPVALGLDKIAGHSTITRAPSDIYILHRPKSGEETLRILSQVATRDGARKNLKIQINPENNSYDFLGYCNLEGETIDAATDDGHTFTQKILDFLLHRPGTEYEAKEISELCGVGYDYCRKACRVLWLQGRIKRVKKGKAFSYFAEPSPPKVQIGFSYSNADTEKRSGVAEPSEPINPEKNIFEPEPMKTEKIFSEPSRVQEAQKAHNPDTEGVSTTEPYLNLGEQGFSRVEAEPAHSQEHIAGMTENVRTALSEENWELIEAIMDVDLGLKKAVWESLSDSERQRIRSLRMAFEEKQSAEPTPAPDPEPTPAPEPTANTNKEPPLPIADKVGDIVYPANIKKERLRGTITYVYKDGKMAGKVMVEWDAKEKGGKKQSEIVKASSLQLFHRKPKFEKSPAAGSYPPGPIHKFTNYQPGQTLLSEKGRQIGRILKGRSNGVVILDFASKEEKLLTYSEIDLMQYQRAWILADDWQEGLTINKIKTPNNEYFAVLMKVVDWECKIYTKDENYKTTFFIRQPKIYAYSAKEWMMSCIDSFLKNEKNSL